METDTKIHRRLALLALQVGLYQMFVDMLLIAHYFLSTY